MVFHLYCRWKRTGSWSSPLSCWFWLESGWYRPGSAFPSFPYHKSNKSSFTWLGQFVSSQVSTWCCVCCILIYHLKRSVDSRVLYLKKPAWLAWETKLRSGWIGRPFHSVNFFSFKGAYHVVYIYLAVRGRQGFNFYNLPLVKWRTVFIYLSPFSLGFFSSPACQCRSYTSLAQAESFMNYVPFFLSYRLILSYYREMILSLYAVGFLTLQRVTW